MRIAIDLQGIQSEGSRSRGIGRYSLEIIKNIVRCSSQFDFILVANAALRNVENELREELDYANVSYFEWFSPCPLDYVSKSNNQFNFGLYLRSYAFSCLNLDLVLITSFLEGFADNCLIEFDKDILNVKTISIFYDLIPLLNPDSYFTGNPEFAKYYHYKLQKLKSLDALLAISSSSANEAVNNLNFDSKKVYNISSACDTNIFNQTNVIITPEKFNSDKFNSFLLYTGASDPRKNVKGLLEAFSKLSAELKDYKLVIAGKLIEAEKELINIWIKSFHIKPDNVIITGYISDQELVWLYRHCSLFIFPSLHEGFGLPVLEAMCCGAPVIGSNSTSVPEIIKIKDALFDPKNIDNIRELIEKAILDIDFRNDLINNSIVQSQKFSWSKCALSAIQAFEDLVPNINNNLSGKSWNNLNLRKSEKLNILVSKIKNHRIKKKYKDELYTLLSSCIDKINIQIDSIFRNQCKLKKVDNWQIEGPFDSSYSLSILNRYFTEALNENIDNVFIHITEGPGDYIPNLDYLKNYPLAFSIYQDSISSSKSIDIVSRNLYPPRVNDMKSQFNMLHAYGWEESTFPSQWVNEFNTYLQGITVMSNQVKKILIDNGVNIPIYKSGLGVDHIDKIKEDNQFKLTAKEFKIVHISSCFPRKGIDILLQSYACAFTIKDNVSLIIKTFRNEHNNVQILLENMKRDNSLFPEVILLEEDFSDNQIKELIRISDVLVAPSRGEGFGLPIGESMRLGTPVIVTAWGGHMDFCNSENSWLIDYEFVNSKSHFNLNQSYWAEPSITHLKELLIEVYSASKVEIQRRTQLAKDSISKFTWDMVAKRNIDFINNKLILHKRKFFQLGIVTTWNSRCGIASYSKNLVSNMEKEVIIFNPFGENSVSRDQKNIVPSWELNKKDQDFTLLINNIISHNITSLIIQFNYGFFSFPQLSRLVQTLNENNINIIILLHSTQDPENDPRKKLILLKDILGQCKRLIVHTLEDVNRLKKIGLIDNVAILPHAIRDINEKRHIQNSNLLTSSTKRNIASFGFCLPNKGYKELIEAIALLKKSDFEINLTIFCSIYSPEFQWVSDDLYELRKNLGLEKYVTINNRYMDEEEIFLALNKFDCLIFPYQFSRESSSASVRQGLQSLKPVLVTPLDIFNDISSLVEYLPGTSPKDLANGLRDWFMNEKNCRKSFLENLDKRRKIISSRSFSIISSRLVNIIKSLELNG